MTSFAVYAPRIVDYEEAPFYLTMTGGATGSSVGRYTFTNGASTIQINAFTGASFAADTINITTSGLREYPSVPISVPIITYDDSTAAVGVAKVGTNGTIVVSTATGSGFANSGFCGFDGFSYSHC